MKAANDELVLEYAIDDAPEKVFRALSVPEFVVQWLGPDLPETVSYDLLEAEKPNRVSYLWRDEAEGEKIASRVTFELTEADDGGTLLRLVHSGLVALPKPANANGPVMMLAA